MSPEMIRAGRSVDAAMRRAEFRAHPLFKGDMYSAIAILLIVGLPLGALLLQADTGPIEAHSPPSLSLLLAGGLLVGFGIRSGSGCPSGHGACEVPRFSRRSASARRPAPTRWRRLRAMHWRSMVQW
jgi:uncharacterized membrane protein YedE/YeeE